MFDRRHINQITTGQRDVRCDTSTLASYRLFCDLDDDLLSLAQKIGDSRLRATLATIIASASTVTASFFAPITISLFGLGTRCFRLDRFRLARFNKLCLGDLVFLET